MQIDRFSANSHTASVSLGKKLGSCPSGREYHAVAAW
jgi:hypothetical protein